jgi:hypothetical protein
LKTSVIPTLLATLFIAAAIVFWQYQPSDPHAPAESLQQPLANNFVPEPLSGQPERMPAAPQFDSDPAGGTLEDGALEMVKGIAVRKDRNCTVELYQSVNPETGERKDAYICTPISLPDIDPYTDYSDTVLAGMAYGDAHAAEILGLRMIVSTDPKIEAQGLKLLLRSVALTHDTRAIALAQNARYSNISKGEALNEENVRQLLVLSHVANAVKPGSMASKRYEALLISNGTDHEELAELKSDSLLILTELADIQAEITGNTYIREVLEDA